MRVFFLLLATIAAVRAQGAHEEKYEPKPYMFNYLAEGEEGSSSHQEESDGTGNVRGSYSLKEADGRERVVEYVAGKEGFIATVITNEPGTENKNPANVIMKSSAENVGDVPGTAAIRTESRLAHPGPQRKPQPRDRMFLVPIEKQ